MHGQFVWYELTTSDVASALKFYPAVTGWGTEEFDQMQYTEWTSDSAPLGGVVQLRPDQLAQGTRSNWIPYISVTDVDSAARQVSSLGGAVHFGPHDIPGTGRFAIVKDPQGALFAVYTALEDAPGFDGTRRLGRFVWHELMTSNPEAAFEFYRKMFGWQKTSASDMGPDIGMYQMFGMNDAEYGGMFKGAGRMAGVPPFWTCYVHVKDVKKAAKTATTLGGQVVNGPMEVPGGDLIAVIMDPQGAAFAVHQGPASEVAKAAASAPRTGRKRARAKFKVKAKAKTKTRTKTKSKAKAARTKPKARAGAKARGKARARPRKKTKAKARPRAHTRAKSKKKGRRR